MQPGARRALPHFIDSGNGQSVKSHAHPFVGVRRCFGEAAMQRLRPLVRKGQTHAPGHLPVTHLLSPWSDERQVRETLRSLTKPVSTQWLERLGGSNRHLQVRKATNWRVL